MWLVLLFALIAMIAAILFARQPEEGKLGFIRGMSTATTFSIIAGVATNTATTLYNIARNSDRFGDDASLYLLIGLAESLSPAILGFSLLGIIWLITAVGIRRLSAV